MSTTDDTDALLAKAGAGDGTAAATLLVRFQTRLRRMVKVRMDERLRRRFDPSDVVQDVLARASAGLQDYLRRRPMAFYPWLRQMAWDQLVELHRRHIVAEKRTVLREEPPLPLPLPNDSIYELAQRLVSEDSSPPEAVLRQEMQARVAEALDQLPTNYREVLVLRFLEGLETADIAAITQSSEGAVRVRLVRALKKVRELLDDDKEKQP